VLVKASGFPSWLDEAWAEYGQKEIPGAGDNSRISAFMRELGHGELARDETPWCAAFVGACLERAGIRSTRSLMARSYLRWGEALEAPAPGCIAVLSRGSNPAHGHVGFVLGTQSDGIFLLGGNQSNAVTVARFSKARLLGWRWPSNEPLRDVDRLFEACFQHVLKMEGGFTDDPVDPGGPTNKGITLRVYAAWKGLRLSGDSRSQLLAELKRISIEECRSIYFERYWKPSKSASFKPALALMHFDASVNHGVTGAARILQEASGAEIDGEIGPKTLAAVREQATWTLVENYANVRERKYRNMQHFWRFGRGWLNRIRKTLDAAEAIKRQFESLDHGEGRESPAVVKSDKGRETMPTRRGVQDGGAFGPEVEPKWWGESLTIWGALITAAATVLPVVGPLVGLDLTEDIVHRFGEQVVVIAQAVGGLAGIVMTIVGRARASRPLTSLPKSTGL